MGLFVEAEIEGREVAAAVRLPRGALRGSAEVVVVDPESKLHVRPVELLRTDGEALYVSGGLAAGERVVVRVPSSFVEGMQVQVAEAPEQSPATAAPGQSPATGAPGP
jgi:multidrug efflux pump subunit AcrA (membrane-fusion protein)